MQPVLFLYDGLPTDIPKADAIHLLHKLSILFIYTGWLLPPRFLWVYLIYVGLTLLSWRFNADICPKTQAEYRARHWNPETTPGFTQLFLIRPFVATLPSPAATESTLTAVALNSIYVLFTIALLRVVFQTNIVNYMTSK